MIKIYNTVILVINNSNSPYYDKEGHILLAREIGVALYGFNENITIWSNERSLI